MRKVLSSAVCCWLALLAGVEKCEASTAEDIQVSASVDALFAQRSAAEITGDELVAALRDLPETFISSNVWQSVRRRLKGRELAFSNLTLSGFSGAWTGSRKHDSVFVVPCPTNAIDKVACRGILLKVFLPTNELDQIGWMQSGDPIRSVVGTVIGPDEAGGVVYGLSLRGAKLVPRNAPPPPLPDFDATAITGDEVLRLWAKLPRRTVYARDLQRKLAGRELTFTNLVVATDVWLRKGAGCDILLGEKEDEFRLSVSFPTSFVERVGWLEKGDRIARLTGRIPSRLKNDWRSGLSLEGLDIVVETPRPKPLSELIDPAKLTGDELLTLVPTLRKSQVNDLAHVLAGRELTFHNLDIVGSIKRDSGSTTIYSLKPKNSKEYATAALQMRVRFDSPELERQTERLWTWGLGENNYIRELKGRIEPSENDSRFASTRELTIKGAGIVLNNPFESIPAFDAKTITGEGVVKLARSFKKGCGPYVPAIAERLVGRTLTFTNAVFESVAYEDDGKALLTFRIEHKIPLAANSWRTDALRLLTEVNAAELDALPWGLSPNDRIPRLSGCVGTMPSRRFGFGCQGIFLEDATFEIPWRNEKLPPFDAATITGDEFMRMAAGFEPVSRQAKIQRMLRLMKGRRLSFSRCTVARGEACEPSLQDGKIRVNFDFRAEADRDDSHKCLLPVIFAGKDEERALCELAMGVQLTNVSGVVTWADCKSSDDRFGDGGYRLAGVDYQLSEPTEELPDFDAATITGDELAEMIVRRKTALTLRQSESLWSKLAGRRLTFTKVYISGSSYSDGFTYTVWFRFRDAPDWRRPDCEKMVSLKDPLPEAEAQRLFNYRARRNDACRVTATVRVKGGTDGDGDSFFARFPLSEGVVERMAAAK